MSRVLISADFYPHLLSNLFKHAGWEVSFLSPIDLAQANVGPGYDLWLHGQQNLAISNALAHPLQAYQRHTATMIKVLAAAMKSACPNLIFISAASVYGEHHLAQENSPLHPLEPNAAGLKMAEEIMAAMPLNTIILRPGEIVGAREIRHPSCNFVQRLSATMLGHPAKFYLAGTDYPTPDGAMIRDLIHVDDFMAAILAASNFLRNQPRPSPEQALHKTFNIGRGIGVSVREMMAAMESAAQQTIPYVCGPREPAQAAELVLANRAAQEILGWHPRPTSLTALAHAALAAQNWINEQTQTDWLAD